MGREIKFRAWNNLLKIMLTPEMNIEEPNLWAIPISRGGIVEYPDGTLMEYVGIKVKEDKEACEADIISHNKNHFIIDWCDIVRSDVYGLYLQDIYNPTNWRDLAWLNRTSKYCEVIGNIYENPELLKIK